MFVVGGVVVAAVVDVDVVDVVLSSPLSSHHSQSQDQTARFQGLIPTCPYHSGSAQTQACNNINKMYAQCMNKMTCITLQTLFVSTIWALISINSCCCNNNL